VDFNAIIKRTSNILLRPQEEWEVISQEKTSKGEVLFGYALPYIIILAISSVAGMFLFYYGFFSISYILCSAVFTFVIPFVAIIISSYIINALAPSFGSVSNIDNAFKLVIYSFTASFLASIITSLLPKLLFIGIAGLYSIFIFWYGFAPMMKTPDDKKAGYAIISILILIGLLGILSVFTEFVLAAFFYTGAVLHI
jgi:hypothetical protein